MKSEDQIIVLNLQNNKHIEKEKERWYQEIEIMLTLLHLEKNTHCWGESLKENQKK